MAVHTACGIVGYPLMFIVQRCLAVAIGADEGTAAAWMAFGTLSIRSPVIGWEAGMGKGCASPGAGTVAT